MHHSHNVPIAGLTLGVLLSFAAAASSPSYARNDRDESKNKHDEIEHSVIQQGFASSPIPKEELNLKGKNPAQVALGSYLTTAGDCIGCHSFPRFLRPGGTPTNMSGQGTAPQYGDPFDPPGPPFFGTPQSVDGQLKANFNKKHFMAGGRCFGSIQARNLTPDDTGRPRGLTEAEFIEAMRVGTDVSCQKKPAMGQPLPTYNGVPDGVCGLPRTAPPGYDPNKLMVMPFVTYHNLTDKDLKAIYAYLSALPKATACNTAVDGCAGPPGIGSGKALNLPSGRYAYTSMDECPNPPPPQ